MEDKCIKEKTYIRNTEELHDTQNSIDNRNIGISRVGIRNFKVPIKIPQKNGEVQQTVGSFNLYVSLNEKQKGIHMSRLSRVINSCIVGKSFNLEGLEEVFIKMLEMQEADEGYIEVIFPYFISKEAPVSQEKSFLNYNCKFVVKKENGDEIKTKIEVGVYVTTSCPCSKNISDYNSHNQRGLVTTRFNVNKFIWLEDIISVIESCGSCEIFSTLKRVDERFITMKMYDNPKFVEDMVRDVFINLKKIEGISKIQVECENEESIHLHNAYAIIKGE